MAEYPTTLPSATVSDYAVQTTVGLSAVQFEHGNNRQRHTARRTRQTFTLTFIFTPQQLWTWQSWANGYGYDWHLMNLESHWSGFSVLGQNLIPLFVRYTSDIAVELVSGSYFKVTVSAEMDLTRQPNSAVPFIGDWIIARDPATAPADVIIGGTPASPSTDNIIAGNPASAA